MSTCSWEGWEARPQQHLPQAAWEPWPSAEGTPGIWASSLAWRERAGPNLKFTYLPVREEGGCSSLGDHKPPGIICFTISWARLEVSSVQPSGPWVLNCTLMISTGFHEVSWIPCKICSTFWKRLPACSSFLSESMSAPHQKMLRIAVLTVEIKSEHWFRVSHPAADGERLGGEEQWMSSLFLIPDSQVSYLEGKWTYRQKVFSQCYRKSAIYQKGPMSPCTLGLNCST